MFYYLHIPKTGGQTLAERLATAFPPDRAYYIREGIKSPEKLEEVRAAGYEFVEAHTGGAALRDAGRDLRILCTVREPISQVISHYRHIRREPRLRLHRAATQLSPAVFFEHYGYKLLNFQARYLVRAFNRPSPAREMQHETRWILDRLGPALDRITWLVPTEAIDEFSQLWAFEQGIHLPLAGASRNHAEPDDVDLAQIRSLLTAQREKLGLDFALWDIAREAYARYRQRVMDSPRLGLKRLANAMCPFTEAESEIRLGQGWYPRGVRDDGIAEWWAGPSAVSEVIVTNAAGATHLEFEVAAVVGISRDQIRVFEEGGRRPLQCSVTSIEDGTFMLYRVALPPGPGPHRLQIVVPAVKSPLEVIEGATDPTRRSFASQRWRLVSR